MAIQCSSPGCQAPNPLENQFCDRCGTPIVRRYLWAVGDWIKAYQAGNLLAERYLLKQSKIVLDTKPALPPRGPEAMPSHLLPYFKLFPYRPHIPQIGGYLPSPDEQINLDIWLLEYGTVPTDSAGELRYPNLLPELSQLWAEAGELRQLSLLWQAAQLWQPLEQRGVAASLLEPSLLRVNGGILQLLELQGDRSPAPSFSELGQTWSPLAAGAAPAITDFLQELCQKLQQGEIRLPQELSDILERGMAQCSHWQQRNYYIFTATDTGPVRDHNEDACYPAVGETVAAEAALAIVCDGIGGQEAGEVASQMAIEILLAESQSLTAGGDCRLSRRLERAIEAANTAISQRNDSEERRDIQRMGTTLVIALARAHEIYLAHVGDSRAYRITSESCHQLTVDDDLASREVCLGYLLYRDAIHYPNAGSLIQALGITDSRSLQSTVQRSILDGDCVFLLCSDGLSDRDRVEQYWRSEIVPLLAGERDLAEVGRRLLAIANERNGHDNTTIALIHCQVQPQAGAEPQPLAFAELSSDFSPASELAAALATPVPIPTPTRPSLPPPSPPPPRNRLRLGIASLVLLAVGAIAYGIWQLSVAKKRQLDLPPSPSPLATPSPSATFPLARGDFFQAKTALPLQTIPQEEASGSLAPGEVPSGSSLKVLLVGPAATWLELQVCQLPQPAKPESPEPEKIPPLSEGKSGWIQASRLSSANITPISPSGQSLGSCVIAEPGGGAKQETGQ
jgi:protein phosphatase